MIVLAEMLCCIVLAVAGSEASTTGALFGLPDGERAVDVYASVGEGRHLVSDEGSWSSLSVAFTRPFESVESLRAGATVSKDGQSFRLAGKGGSSSFKAGRVARIVFPAGTDMKKVAIDYADAPCGAASCAHKTQLVPTGGAPLTFPRKAFVALSGDAALTELRAVSTASGGIRALTLGFTSLDGVSAPSSHNASGLDVSSFRSEQRSAIGWVSFAGDGFLPHGPVLSTLSFRGSARSVDVNDRPSNAFDLANPNAGAEDADYNQLDLVLIDIEEEVEPTPPQVCKAWRKKMSKKKTKDLTGTLVLVDEDGDQIGKKPLAGYDDEKYNTCADLTSKGKCKKAYRRDVESEGGDLSRVVLVGCKWSKRDGCIDDPKKSVDVTTCITQAKVETKAGRWWAAWGRAAMLGAVVVLPTGAAYKLRRRRRQQKEQQPAAPAAGENVADATVVSCTDVTKDAGIMMNAVV